MFFYGFEMVFMELRYKKKNMVVFFLMFFLLVNFWVVDGVVRGCWYRWGRQVEYNSTGTLVHNVGTDTLTHKALLHICASWGAVCGAYNLFQVA